MKTLKTTQATAIITDMKLYATLTKPHIARAMKDNIVRKLSPLMPRDPILCSSVNPGDGMTAAHCIALHPGLTPDCVVVHFWNCQVGGYSCGDYYQRSELKAALVAYEERCKRAQVDPYPPTAPTSRNVA